MSNPKIGTLKASSYHSELLCLKEGPGSSWTRLNKVLKVDLKSDIIGGKGTRFISLSFLFLLPLYKEDATRVIW